MEVIAIHKLALGMNPTAAAAATVTTEKATVTLIAAEVRRWVLDGCRWKNNPFYNDPVEALCKGDKLLSHQFVFIDVLDCIFARGEYKHLRPVGRYKQSHSDASFSRNIYTPLSPENIPLQITKKYASNPRGIELARNEWEYEKISRGSMSSSSSTTPTKENDMTQSSTPTQVQEKAEAVDVNLMTRECAFSFIQIWLSQVIHDSDLQSEKIALSILHKVAQLPRSDNNNAAYIQAIRNMIILPSTLSSNAPFIHVTPTEKIDTIMKTLFVLLITRDLVQDLRFNWGCQDLHRLRLPLRYTITDGQVWENVFFPVIIASIPHLQFSRGSLAGIVALAEVLAYHVIAPTHALATTLCTELVKRINTHALGYETALRATRAALTRWAFEQNRPSTGDRQDVGDGNEHDLDEPKEIVLPLLVRFRASLIQTYDVSTPSVITSSRQCTRAHSDDVVDIDTQPRKRGRSEDEDEGDSIGSDDSDDCDGEVIDYTRQCSRHIQSAGSVSNSCRNGHKNKSQKRGKGLEVDNLFTPHSLQRAAEEAQSVLEPSRLLIKSSQVPSGVYPCINTVTTTPHTATGGARAGEDCTVIQSQSNLEVLDECISIIERVMRKRVEDSRIDSGASTADESEGVKGRYVDMVSDILDDLQALDLAGGLKDREVVAAAIENTCLRMHTMTMDH